VNPSTPRSHDGSASPGCLVPAPGGSPLVEDRLEREMAQLGWQTRHSTLPPNLSHAGQSIRLDQHGALNGNTPSATPRGQVAVDRDDVLVKHLMGQAIPKLISNRDRMRRTTDARSPAPS
jgi:hypothetical protein